MLAKGKTDTGRIWVCVRDDRPFGGTAPPAAAFYCSRDRTAQHPEAHLSGFAGILQADAYAGHNRLYDADRRPGPIVEAVCWAHSRRKFFVLADIAANAKRGKAAPPISPMALEAVKRIDALFDIERAINGLPPDRRLAVRAERSAPPGRRVGTLDAGRTGPPRSGGESDGLHAEALGPIQRIPGRRPRLPDQQRRRTGIARHRPRPQVLAFRRVEPGGCRAAFMYSLIVTAKMNDVDPQAWLADVLARIADLPQRRLPESLPWNWTAARQTQAV